MAERYRAYLEFSPKPPRSGVDGWNHNSAARSTTWHEACPGLLSAFATARGPSGGQIYFGRIGTGCPRR
jgi:hypothetical protein